MSNITFRTSEDINAVNPDMPKRNADMLIYCMVCRNRIELPEARPFDLKHFRHPRVDVVCKNCGFTWGYMEARGSRGKRELAIYPKILKEHLIQCMLAWQARKMKENWMPGT